MMKLIITLNLMLFSTLMYFMNHPLAMGLLLLIQTIFITLISGLIMKTFWFSYILFLVFLGGMLVMFIYVCSLASNEMFKYSFNMIINFMFMILITLMLTIYFMDNLNLFNNYINMDMEMFLNKFMFFNNENKMNISKIYNNQSYFLTMLLIIYLLISLFAVIKIINIKQGPLRKFN